LITWIIFYIVLLQPDIPQERMFYQKSQLSTFLSFDCFLCDLRDLTNLRDS
jgi:hypothetical protein